jgi:hypothetical protein
VKNRANQEMNRRKIKSCKNYEDQKITLLGHCWDLIRSPREILQGIGHHPE